MAHVGFGSDSGGGLPHLLAGWRSQASLPDLITAMRQAGLSQEDVTAFLGGNVLRVLQACLG
jgi:microsomal dipeptidase-like Zn-dependent dipeptidase